MHRLNKILDSNVLHHGEVYYMFLDTFFHPLATSLVQKENRLPPKYTQITKDQGARKHYCVPNI